MDVRNTLAALSSDNPNQKSIEKGYYYSFLYWFGRKPQQIDNRYKSISKTNNQDILEHLWLFQSKKYGVTGKLFEFASTSRTINGFNLCNYIRDIVYNKPEELVRTYSSRLPSQIKHFMNRDDTKQTANKKCQKINKKPEKINKKCQKINKNEHCPYTAAQYREMIKITSEMLSKQ